MPKILNNIVQIIKELLKKKTQDGKFKLDHVSNYTKYTSLQLRSPQKQLPSWKFMHKRFIGENDCVWQGEIVREGWGSLSTTKQL